MINGNKNTNENILFKINKNKIWFTLLIIRSVEWNKRSSGGLSNHRPIPIFLIRKDWNFFIFKTILMKINASASN